MTGCRVSPVREACPADGEATYEQYTSRVAEYPFEAPPPRAEHLVEAYPKLALGMSRAEVRAILGPPDFSQSAVRKKSGDCLAIIWRYVLYDLDEAANETWDRNISVASALVIAPLRFTL
jgi:hypothetical protein